MQGHNVLQKRPTLINAYALTIPEVNMPIHKATIPMAEKISNRIGKTINFISPNLMQFFLTKRKENMPTMLILVMIMLHYFPRFQKTPKTTEWVKIITGREPKSFDDFVLTNKNQLQ